LNLLDHVAPFSKQFPGLLARCFRDVLACHHTGNFLYSILSVKGRDSNDRSPVTLPFVDMQMVRSPAGDLRKVGHTENLVPIGQSSKLFSHGRGDSTSNSRIHFIED
jgi:hypothetical protein